MKRVFTDLTQEAPRYVSRRAGFLLRVVVAHHTTHQKPKHAPLGGGGIDAALR